MTMHIETTTAEDVETQLSSLPTTSSEEMDAMPEPPRSLLEAGRSGIEEESNDFDPTQPLAITMDELTDYYCNAVTAVKAIREGKEQEGRVLKPPPPMAKKFVSAVRNAVMSRDEPTGLYENLRITPCLHDDDDEFTRKASNFMDMCSGPVAAGANEDVEEGTSKPGHIKIEQAFRPKGNIVEGWVYVRWMEVGWRAAGFKAHRIGSLPLVMFSRQDENEALRDTLDRIMEEVYPVLVECFPHCHIVPIQTCEELWANNRNPSMTKDGSELRAALMRAQAQQSSKNRSEGGSNEFSVRSSRKTKAMDASDTTATRLEDFGSGELEASVTVLPPQEETEPWYQRIINFRPSAFQVFSCWSSSVLITTDRKSVV